MTGSERVGTSSLRTRLMERILGRVVQPWLKVMAEVFVRIYANIRVFPCLWRNYAHHDCTPRPSRLSVKCVDNENVRTLTDRSKSTCYWKGVNGFAIVTNHNPHANLGTKIELTRR